jgi:hypothetical protein
MTAGNPLDYKLELFVSLKSTATPLPSANRHIFYLWKTQTIESRKSLINLSTHTLFTILVLFPSRPFTKIQRVNDRNDRPPGRKLFKLKTGLEFKLIRVAFVIRKANRPIDHHRLTILQLFADRPANYRLRKNREQNLLLHTPTSQHPTPNSFVGKISHYRFAIMIFN